MKPIRIAVGEGKNDQLFIHEFARHYLGIENRLVVIQGIYQDHRKNFKKLQYKLSNPKERKFLADKIIIFGDNGKRNLIKSFVPRLFVDYVNKISLELLVLVDEDGSDIHKIYEDVYQSIENHFKGVPANLFKEKDFIITAKSESKPRDFYVKCKIFAIPESLEKQIASDILKRSGSKISNTQNPHSVIEQASEIYKMKVDDLIRKSTIEWLDIQKEWIKHLIKVFIEYFGIDN